MNVNFYATFRQVVGAKSIELDLPVATPLQQALDLVLRTYPGLAPLMADEAGQARSHVRIFVNGRDAQYLPDGMATPLAPGDKIDIFPPVAGGAAGA